MGGEADVAAGLLGDVREIAGLVPACATASQ
jgi:hypothetical protein